MRPCEHDGPDRLVPPLNGTIPARRGTAAAATRRALLCTSRTASPGLDPPLPRRSPSRRPTGRAAAWQGVLRTSRRACATLRSPSSGRVGPSGAAAWLPAARAPRAPAADPSSGPSLAASAVPSARTRHRPQRPCLGLDVAFFRSKMCRLQIDLFSKRSCCCFICWGRFFHQSYLQMSKTKLIKENINKTSIHFATPTYDGSLVALNATIESRFECCPAGSVESCHGTDRWGNGRSNGLVSTQQLAQAKRQRLTQVQLHP